MVSFSVADISIEADRDLTGPAHVSLKKHLGFIEKYLPDLDKAPLFAPRIIRDIRWAARKALVVPMAILDGALIDRVGHDLLRLTRELIIEKGDVHFLRLTTSYQINVSDGSAMVIAPADMPCGISVKSAAVVISASTTLASAAASAIEKLSPEEGLAAARKIRGLKGVLIHRGEQMGVIGKVNIVRSV